MVVTKCPGHKSIENGVEWIFWGFIEWRHNVKNSKQRNLYINAIHKKFNAWTMPSMISVYDSYETGTGKISRFRQNRCMSLFSDGSFFALEETSEGFLMSFPQIKYVFGKWDNEIETMVNLQRQEGTNFTNYAFIDLSLNSNFLKNACPIQLPFRTFPTYEVQREFLLKNVQKNDAEPPTP